MCPSVHVFWFRLDNISWTASLFVTKHGIVVHYHEPECHAEKLICFLLRAACKMKVTAMGFYHQNRTISSLAQCLLNFWSICNQSWFCGTSPWARVSCGNLLLLLLLSSTSSRSRSQRGFIWSKYDSFYYIFWTIDSLATKLDLMIHNHKPECLVKKLDYCIQDQGHSERSKC